MTHPGEGLEGALGRIETEIELAAKATAAVARELKKARSAARTGTLRELQRALETAEQLTGTLVDSTRSLRAGWRFDDRAYLESGAYTDELLRAGEAAGVQLFEQDGRVVSYPSLVRILPADASLEVDKKRERRIRPSFVAQLLRQHQSRPPRFKAEAFIEALHKAYRLALAERGRRPGTVVPLTDIYGKLTLLPGQSREYAKQEFARDIYLLDQSGVDRTKAGARISFPASTGTRGSGRIDVVTRAGATRAYYGISFEL